MLHPMLRDCPRAAALSSFAGVQIIGKGFDELQVLEIVRRAVMAACHGTRLSSTLGGFGLRLGGGGGVRSENGFRKLSSSDKYWYVLQWSACNVSTTGIALFALTERKDTADRTCDRVSQMERWSGATSSPSLTRLDRCYHRTAPNIQAVPRHPLIAAPPLYSALPRPHSALAIAADSS